MGTIAVSRMDTENRWPRWAAAAAESGVMSMLAVRLDLAGQRLAASLNLFADRPAEFDATDAALASLFAQHAAQALAEARVVEGLRTAAQSRETVGVAERILMQHFGLTVDQSFELLRRYSQASNVKIRTLADHLVESGGIPQSPEPSADLNEALGLGDPAP